MLNCPNSHTKNKNSVCIGTKWCAVNMHFCFYSDRVYTYLSTCSMIIIFAMTMDYNKSTVDDAFKKLYIGKELGLGQNTKIMQESM